MDNNVKSADTENEANIEADKKTDKKYIKLEEVEDPIKIRSRRGVVTISKKLLMKARYFEAFFNRWSAKDITHIDLPDDVDPDMFMEIIYKLRNPNHLLKYKVVKDYYDYYGVDYEKKEKPPAPEDKVKTFKDIITIVNSEQPSKFFVKDISSIVRAQFVINVPIEFSYSRLKGLSHKDRWLVSAEDKEYARSQLEILLKDKSHYVKLVEQTGSIDKETILYLSDLDLYSARDDIVTFCIIPLKSFLTLTKDGTPRYDFTIQVFGNGELEISVEMKRK